MERGWTPSVELSPNCPRCGSSNTKFCYYNNYSLTQPRYFCKGCRRYWTKGGSLRNVPVGGGCRKNRRCKSVRLSSDQAAVSSEFVHYGVGANNQKISQSYGAKVSNNSLDVNSSSSLMQDGSHIDLALVYANFLNKQPAAKSTINSAALESIIPEFPSELDPSLEFSSIANRVQILPEENGLVGCLSISDLSLETHLRENDQICYSSASDTVQRNDHVNFDHTRSNNNQTLPIPPLASEDQMASHHYEEIMWLNSHMMVNHNSLEATQGQILGPEDQVVQDPNLLFGNWSPFDFSSDYTFTKT